MREPQPYLAEPEHQPFLNKINAEPDEAFPRLVYADWLDEKGLTDEADRQRRFKQSLVWLQEFAVDNDCDFDEMIWVAQTHHDGSSWPNFLMDGGKWEGATTPKEFWEHYSVWAGEKVQGGRLFSCSC